MSAQASTWARRWPVIILAVYLLTAVYYSLMIPLGEAYDEWAHFAYIRYVVNNRELPDSGQRLVPQVMYDETHQPPLYYLIGALATGGIDMTDGLQPEVNPSLSDGYTLNAYIRGPEYDWPWTGSVLGMHVARGVSIVMGALIVWLTYRIGRRLAPEQPYLATVSMALVAFMPQFLFTSSIVTNDIAVALFSTIALLLLVRLEQMPTLREVLWLIPVALAAVLSKANGVALLPAILSVLVVAVLKRWRALSWAKRLGLIGAACMLIAAAIGVLALWESWNVALQGSASTVSGALTRFILPALLSEGAGAQISSPDTIAWGLLYTYRTFWASFGFGNIQVGTAFYVLMGLIMLTGLVGLGIRLRRQHRQSAGGYWALGLYALWIMVPPLFLILVSQIGTVSPGRYLMALAPVCALIQAIGLDALIPQRFSRHALGAYAAAMLAFSLFVPVGYIRPAYQQGARLTPEELAREAETLDYRYGDAMALVGYRLPEQTSQPGGTVEVVLYWQCLQEMDTDYMVSVQIVDPAGVFYGGSHSYPGRGNDATGYWKAGEIIEDRYQVHIGDDFPAPAYAMAKVDVYRDPGLEYLPLTVGATDTWPHSAIFGRFRVVVPGKADRLSRGEQKAVYGDVIALAGWQIDGAVPGNTATVTLDWRALSAVSRDYTVALHLYDSQGELVVQADGQPFAGRYPTGLWQTSDILQEQRQIDIPADLPEGAYTLAIGWYDLQTLQRLVAVDSSGAALADSLYAVPIYIEDAD